MATEASDVSYRASHSSSRSSGSRKQQNPQQQLSQIEKSVTHLLVATKQLLETLTQWSRGNSTEGEVSDVYVRLGYEFNIACRAFNAIGVDTQDLGPVPDLLRSILEDTLSQEASQASLDKYLPRIRDIIINLLQGLKKKQSRLRAKTAREIEKGSGSGLQQDLVDQHGPQQPDGPSRHGSVAAPAIRRESLHQSPSRPLPGVEGRSSPANTEYANRPDKFDKRATLNSSDTSLSSGTAQTIPVIAPYPEEDTMPYGEPEAVSSAARDRMNSTASAAPKQQDALLALQRGGDLERRASRRFSTYHLGKQLGGAANGIIPMMPPAQHPPLPNRGREVRESLQAVRSRGSQLYQRQRSARRLAGETSPVRAESQRDPESATQLPQPPPIPAIETPEDNEITKTPVDKLAPTFPDSNSTARPVTPTSHIKAVELPASDDVSAASLIHRKYSRKTTASPDSFVPEDSPQPGKPLTLFLQYKTKVKKLVLEEGSNDLSIGRIQLAFIDKFAWNTQNNGVDLPEIYIQDSVSGVRYELEDLSDIKNNTVLALNVEAMEEVKRHFDDSLGNLRNLMEEVKTALTDQHSIIQRVNDKQQEAAKDIASLAAAPVNRMSAIIQPTRNTSMGGTLHEVKLGSNQLGEIQSLRRDLAVLRQTYSSFVSDINASMTTIRTKAASVKSVAVKVALPDLKGESGRAIVNKSIKTLNEDQQKVVDFVEDVQDSIEDLRKDVVTRGVRPLPRQLEQVAKDISNAMQEVKKMETRLAKEKPLWSKIWKAELQQVCDDRDMVAEADALLQDFKDDLESANETFRLVEEATKQQNLAVQNTSGNLDTSAVNGSASFPRNLSNASRIAALNADRNVDPHTAKDSMLGEVKGLKIDHEERLEAISRAERARQRELLSRNEGEAFKKELGAFVDEGKLKKTGGVDEVERVRKMREEKAKRDFMRSLEDRKRGAVEERKRAMAEERERIRAEERAAEEAGGNDDDGEEENEEEGREGDDEDEGEGRVRGEDVSESR